MMRKLWTASLLVSSLLIFQQLPASEKRVIYGDDNRLEYFQEPEARVRLLADSAVALIRASKLVAQGETTQILTQPYGPSLHLCADEPFYSQETAAFCSGFLVASDLIVTAGHCIGNQATCDNTRFVFGFRKNTANRFPNKISTNNIYGCREIIYTVSTLAEEDFAVIRLDRPVAEIAPLALRTYGTVQVGQGLTVIGHPEGLPLKIAGGAVVRDVQPQFLVANLDSYGGNSGSPVFNADSGEVEGILVRGETDFIYDNGCYRSKICLNSGCRGEDVTLSSRVLPYILRARAQSR